MEKTEFNVNDLLSQDKKTIKEDKVLGRPKKKDKSDNRIVTYLNDKEYHFIERLSDQQGLSISNTIKLIIREKIEKE